VYVLSFQSILQVCGEVEKPAQPPNSRCGESSPNMGPETGTGVGMYSLDGIFIMVTNTSLLRNEFGPKRSVKRDFRKYIHK
jgi:hypothetical protein